MILAKAPLRITFVGGSSDLPIHYMKHTGHTISMAIDQYVYVSLMETPHEHIKVAYSQTETVSNLDDLQHDLIRETLRYFNLKSNIEITTFATIPTVGTGLGGSSAFVCALIAAIAKYKQLDFTAYDIAELATDIELKYCKHNIGKQDQYISAFGGMLHCQYGVIDTYGMMDRVLVAQIDPYHIDKNILLIPTLQARKPAHETLDTIDFSKQAKYIINLADMAKKLSTALPSLNEYSTYLNQAWEFKKKTSPHISNEEIDNLHSICMSSGAHGCKLLGAGGGGYLMVLTSNRDKLINIFSDRTCLKVSYEPVGAKVVYYD